MFKALLGSVMLDTSGTVGESATQTPTPTQSPLFIIVWIVVLGALFYFMMYRPQKKKEKQKKNMLDNMKKGDKITTIGGIQGRIAQIKDESIVIEVASLGGAEKVKIEIQKWAIGSIDSQDDTSAD